MPTGKYIRDYLLDDDESKNFRVALLLKIFIQEIH
ncbi:hypothetical protein M2130_002138 [Polynucleobacter sphagniphilus]|nr:hypothetical protein [Polynucleobacter sphagniphilus]